MFRFLSLTNYMCRNNASVNELETKLGCHRFIKLIGRAKNSCAAIWMFC